MWWIIAFWRKCLSLLLLSLNCYWNQLFNSLEAFLEVTPTQYKLNAKYSSAVRPQLWWCLRAHVIESMPSSDSGFAQHSQHVCCFWCSPFSKLFLSISHSFLTPISLLVFLLIFFFLNPTLEHKSVQWSDNYLITNTLIRLMITSLVCLHKKWYHM